MADRNSKIVTMDNTASKPSAIEIGQNVGANIGKAAQPHTTNQQSQGTGNNRSGSKK